MKTIQILNNKPETSSQGMKLQKLFSIDVSNGIINPLVGIKTGLILLIFFVLQINIAKSQETWSLERCVTYAIDNNITVKQQALNVNYRENQLLQSKYSLIPSLDASLGHNFVFGKSTNIDNTFSSINSQSTSVGANSNVMIFNGMAKQNTIKQRKFELQSALKDLEKTKDDISLAVAQGYLEILFNKELVSSTKEHIEVTKEQIEHNKKQVEAGSLAKGKLLETESQLANEELTLTNYENQLQLSLLNLMQLLELPISNTFDIVIPEFEASMLDAGLLSSKDVFNKAVSERPEILSKELALKSFETEGKIAKAQLYPSISAFASYNNFYNNQYVDISGDKMTLSKQLELNGQNVIGLSIRVPIFNGLSAKTNVKNSQINYENSKYQLQLEKNNLEKEIQQVHLNAVAAMKKFYSSEKAVHNANEAFRYVEEKFNLGIVTPLEYNDSKDKVTNAESSFIQAKYEYIFRIKILDFYNGKKIVL